MKRSTNKLYKPWVGIVSILFTVVLVSACASGGGNWRDLEIGIVDCTNGDEYDHNDYRFNLEDTWMALLEMEDTLIDEGIIYIPLDQYHEFSSYRDIENFAGRF